MNHSNIAEYQHEPEDSSSVQNQPRLSTRWAANILELESIKTQWTELASQSILQNPTLTPGFLIPALTHLNDCDARCLIVENISDPADIRLFGLLPIVDQKIYGIPVKTAAIWKHDYCFDGTPLIHRGYVTEVIAEVFRFLATEKYSLLKLAPMVADDTLNQAIEDNLEQFGGSLFIVDKFERAAFEPANDAEQYELDNLSKKFRQKSQRLARRLADEGDVVYEQADENSDFYQLALQFLELELSGWKGKNGTAIGCKTSSKKFYLDSILRLSGCGQARFLTLKLDNKPIAMISCMSSGSRVQAFKTAFDETYSSYSPGVAIEIYNLELMHTDGITFADSCAATSHSAMNRIWGQKVPVQNIVLTLKSGAPTLLVRSLPLLQKLIRTATRFKLRK